MAQVYPGPVVDEVTGLKQSSRRVWRMQGRFHTTDGDYAFLDILEGAAMVALLRFGMAPKGVKNPLVKMIVADMVAQLEDAGQPADEPRYLLACQVTRADKQKWMRMARKVGEPAGDEVGDFYTEGYGTIAVRAGLSTTAMREHLDSLADSDSAQTLLIDTAKVLRGVLRKLRELGQVIPGEEVE